MKAQKTKDGKLRIKVKTPASKWSETMRLNNQDKKNKEYSNDLKMKREFEKNPKEDEPKGKWRQEGNKLIRED